MFRFTTFLFVSLFILVLCTPSVITPSDAITFAQAAEADEEIHEAGTLRDDGDEESEDDDDDVQVDDEDDAGLGDEDDEDEEGYDDEDQDSPEDTPSEPDKPAVIDPPGDENAKHTAPKPDGNVIFFDDFQSGMSKWTHSAQMDYNGKFQIGQGAKPTIRGDRSLIIPEKARKYGLSSKVEGLDNLSGKDVIIQYELKLEEGVTCGGSYIKLPLKGFVPADLTGETSYSIMFGPDKCGTTDKVHFIFQSRNPKTNKLVEHHLKNPPTIANSYDKKTHLYTLIVKKDATFELQVDTEKKSYGSLLDKFEPSLQPEEKIDDPNDKKPEHWVDEKQIQDPDATKPEDWDEDEPKTIVDEDSVKPEGWLDDEPEKIEDPEAKRPDSWDEEEDGEWEKPLISNPKCEEVGCGKWEKKMKANPNYKGKWKAPMIDNPKYIGEWSPKKIDNPDYYKVEEPQLLGIGGIAFEIWTMDQGVLFDNLYIGTDIESAEKFANSTFRMKQKIELDREEAERKKEDEENAKKEKSSGKSGDMSSSKLGKTLGPVLAKIESLIDDFERILQPLEKWLKEKGLEPYLDRLIDLGIKKPMIVVVLMPLTITFLILALLGGGKKEEEEEESMATNATEATEMDSAAEKKKTDGETEDMKTEGDDATEEINAAEGEENGIESTGLRQRNVTSEE